MAATEGEEVREKNGRDRWPLASGQKLRRTGRGKEARHWLSTVGYKWHNWPTPNIGETPRKVQKHSSPQ